MRVKEVLAGLMCIQLILTGCGNGINIAGESREQGNKQTEAERISAQTDMEKPEGPFDENTKIDTVRNDPVFEDYGRLLFPVDDWYMDGDTLGNLRLTWYSNIDPGETVAIVNTLWQRADAGETVFYDLYSQEEKAADPAKKKIPACFSSKANPEPGLRYVMPEADSPMWEPCRTAFPMHWNCQNSVTMPSR